MELIPLTKEEERFLFFDEIQSPKEMYYKIYHDGGHYVGNGCSAFRSEAVKYIRYSMPTGVGIAG